METVKEELLMLTYGEYKLEDGVKTLHSQKEIILHIDRDPVNPEDGHCAYLVLGQNIWMTTNRGEQMDMHNGVNLCPNNARGFIAGLGLGLILLYLARAKKTREVVVGEINPHVIEVIEPRLRSWFSEYYPDFNWQVIQGDAKVEAQKHGKFDWFFWDIWPVADFKKRASDEFIEISRPHLTKGGIITTWHDLAKMRRDMKEGLDFKPYQNYVLTGNMNQSNLRIRSLNPVDREKKYWEKRYASGRTSGKSPEEVAQRNQKIWRAIEQELPEVNHIIDVGCGDLRIWGNRGCEHYVGTDIAMEVLQTNKNKHPKWKFICGPAELFIPDLSRENVFCFNVMYHILSPENVNKIVRNLCRYATKRIFIYTWIRNPFFPKVTDGKYQYYHPMGKLLPQFNREGFELTSLEFIEDPSALYIYERQSGTPIERFSSDR